ncbi:MAG: U32 family peptidase, partial [Chloroflexi bacterium]|nr:U32 family peptidase [Chloroflexota bacterium]
MIRPEVMSPAGYWPQLEAAIEAGADAVYFGLTHFTARAKVGFTLEELPDVMKTLHRRGVRGYLTFNTLIFGHELAEASRAIAAIAAAGTDAVIVQDIGMAQLAHQIAPELEVHGSTQMSITNAAGVEFARRLGINRVVLARELSLEEIRAIKRMTDLELEIFVHGALCVSYSGQCFSSEAWGGRSANRGQCAQACRLPYDLLVDGAQRPLGDARYLLSPGDLMALDLVPEIVNIGIASLKIEGRYKDADYVAMTTRAYRQAVDAALKGQVHTATSEERIALEQVYSRGLAPSFISGTNHQTVVNGRAPRHRGVEVGRVVAIQGDAIVITPNHVPLKAGDGLVFDAADWRSPEEPEEGGRIFAMHTDAPQRQRLLFGRGAINTKRIRVGDIVWRTHDPDLAKLVKPYLDANQPVARQPVRVLIETVSDTPVRITWQLVHRPQVTVTQQVTALQEDARPLTREIIVQQFGRLGGTAYALDDVQFHGDVPFCLPLSTLNQLRREAVAQLEALQGAAPERTVHDAQQQLQQAQRRIVATGVRDDVPRIHVLVRQQWQLAAAIAAQPASITLDYLELYGLKDAVAQVRAAGIAVHVASPRVIKPGEERVVTFLRKLECPILVRGAGLLQELHVHGVTEMIGDFSLNAANPLSAQLLRDAGISRLAPTHDCNAVQIAEMVRHLGSEAIEVIVYHHLPVFHTEHCVFCRFLSNGTSYKDCGRPCEQHQVALRDRNGRVHPVIADVGCRNTVFGGEAQEGSKHMASWLTAGVRHIRLEFVQEQAAEIAQVVHLFRQGLSGTMNWSDVGRQLRHIAPSGT